MAGARSINSRPVPEESRRMGNNTVSDTTTQFKKQLPRNSFFQMLSFVSQVAIGIWLVPYFVKHLGRAAYGLIPLAGMMTQYVALISYSVSSAVNRFLQDDAEEANRIFNTAFFSYLALGLLQIPVFGLIVYFANAIFSIPEELYRDAIILLVCGALSFLLNLVCSVFVVPMYANNRLDIWRGIDVGRQIARVVGIVVLFLTLGPALRYVGYVDLAVTTMLCAAHLAVARRLAPMLRLTFRCYDWRKVRELTGMGGWLLVNYLGALLFLRIDVWVCNRFISAEAAGDYAAVLQWSNLIRHAGAILGGVIAPMIMIYYARSEIENLIRLSKVSVRVLSLALSVPIGVLCAFSALLLKIWLGESFMHLAPLMVLMLCHLVVNVGVSPLFNIQIAMNKVKWPGIVTCLTGILNVVLAIWFVKYLNWGLYGVAVVGAVVLTAKNAFFTPIYAAAILRQPWHTFLRPYLAGCGLMAGLAFLAYAVTQHVNVGSWMHLVLGCLSVGAAGLFAVWVLLPRRDRRLMVDLMPGRLRALVAKLRLIPA